MLECSLVFHRKGQMPAQASAMGRMLDEIFVVPVCSIFAATPSTYVEFLQQAGALERASRIVAAADLRRPRSAEIARREVRAIVTAAEVEALTPGVSDWQD